MLTAILLALVPSASAYDTTLLNAEAAMSLTLPSGGLSAGPGFRLATDAHLGKPSALAIGAELDLRLPTSGDRVLTGPSISKEVEVSAKLLVFGAGLRVIGHIGDPDKPHLRVGCAGGLALVRMATEDPSGSSVQAEQAPWARPQVGVVVPAGPGAVTGTLLVGFAPADLYSFNGNNGGVSAAAGYRIPLARRKTF